MQQSAGQKNFIKIFCLIFSIASTGLAIVTVRAARKIIEEERQIDAHGVTTAGRVARAVAGSSKAASPFQIEFTFPTAMGQQLTHSSPVSSSDFRQLHPGDPVQVEYVPGEDDLCRLKISTSRADAEASFLNVGVLLFTGLIFFPFIGYAASKNNPTNTITTRPTSRPKPKR